MGTCSSDGGEDRFQAIGRLAGGVAHDLNNLLALISGLAALARERAVAGRLPLEELEELGRATDRGAELSQRLLAVAGRQALRPWPVEIGEVLLAAEERLREILGKEIELRLVLGQEAGIVRIDARQLDRVLVSLAEVAAARMPDGGCLELETGIVPGGGREGHCTGNGEGRRFVLLRARDSGPALQTTEREHVFEPYYSADRGPGLGLSLAVVRGIVSQSGGIVRVHSAPPAGVCFELLLPRADLDRP